MSRSPQRFFLFSGSLVLLLFFDQWVKAIVRALPGERFSPNSGIAFSLPFPSSVFFPLFFLVGGVLLFFFFSASQKKQWGEAGAFLAILLGGVSNVVDRFRWGAVTDVFFLPGGLSWNIADGMIVAGLLFLLFYGSHTFFRGGHRS